VDGSDRKAQHSSRKASRGRSRLKGEQENSLGYRGGGELDSGRENLEKLCTLHDRCRREDPRRRDESRDGRDTVASERGGKG